MTNFENAKSYQIEGCDHYESPEECLEQWCYSTNSMLNGNDLDPKEVEPLTVHAFAVAPRVVLDLDCMTDEFMTTFEEAFAEENFNVSDDIDKLKDHDEYTICKQAIWAALESFEESLPVTRLEDQPFASRTYSVDEILAVLHPRDFGKAVG